MSGVSLGFFDRLSVEGLRVEQVELERTAALFDITCEMQARHNSGQVRFRALHNLHSKCQKKVRYEYICTNGKGTNRTVSNKFNLFISPFARSSWKVLDV